jgi:hypothetical protein
MYDDIAKMVNEQVYAFGINTPNIKDKLPILAILFSVFIIVSIIAVYKD